MCGICGEIGRGGRRIDKTVLQRMTALLAHRGPDAQGIHLEEAGEWSVGLGHRRLSVIDIAGGVQPMFSEDGALAIIFNGEIYNFRELRANLEKKGRRFNTSSDTEVILQQYALDGPECVHKFNGMWAFAIWDREKRRLFLSRDRMGVKPLYYTECGERFLFASEIRPLIAGLSEAPPLDPAALWAYLVIRYVPAPRTLFQGVKKLLPGHNLTLDGNGIRAEAYWRLSKEPEPVSGRAAEEAVRELFEDAVRMRLVADVPLGAFLSGGIDSTAVVAAMRKYKGEGIETFSVDFHAEAGAGHVNETKWSRLAAGTFHTDHHALTVSAKDALDALPVVAERLDDLVSDPAAIPTYLISRFARERVTVVLTGEGGDELFAGYQRYRLGSLAALYQPIPRALRRAAFEIPFSHLPHTRRIRKGIAALSADSPAGRHLVWLVTIAPEMADKLLRESGGGREAVEAAFGPAFAGQRGAFDLDRTLRADIGSWLPDDLLTKVDRSSMAVGLEARVPFLDYRLVELAMRIPAAGKADFFRGKKIFKRAVAGMVPTEIVRRKKAGFTLPIDEWFRGELLPLVREHLSPERIEADGLLDPSAVSALLNEHLSGRERQGHALFSLLLLQLWRDSIKNCSC